MKIELPIAQRELRLAAHSARLYRVRAGMAAAGALLLAWAFLAFDGMARQSTYLLGQAIFFFSAWTVFVLAGGAFGATADCISSEKRAGTLGLLFLTHLKGWDIILGKLLAQSLRYFVGIGALLPILALPILLGGVEFEQCLRLTVSIANMMLFSVAAGLLASTLCLRKQVAESKALQIVLLFTIVLPLLARTLRHFGYDGGICLGLDLVSPLYAQRLALGGLVGPQAIWFSVSVLSVFLLSCSLLAVAAWVVPGSWQQRASAGAFQRIQNKITAAFYSAINSRSPRGSSLLDRNPFQWLAVRDLSRRRLVLVMIAGSVLLVAISDSILAIFFPRSGFALLLCSPVLLILFSITKMRTGTLAAGNIATAKESGILESILASHVGMQEIIRAQFRALSTLYGWPLVVLSLVSFGGLLYSLTTIDRLSESISTSQPDAFRFRGAVILALSLLFLFFDSVALTWAGMLCAFKTSTPGKANSWTGFLVLAAPNVVYLAAIVLLLEWNVIAPLFETFYPPVILWAAIKFINNMAVILYARTWLRRSDRTRRMEPLHYVRNDGFWPAWLLFGSARRERLP